MTKVRRARTRATISAGDGWGGPAKGASDKPSGKARLVKGAHTREAIASKRLRSEEKDARADALEDKLFDLAMNAEREETQVMAATRLHAIYKGQPIARNLNANVDDISQLSDADLHAEYTRLCRAADEASSGDETTRGEGESSGLVH